MKLHDSPLTRNKVNLTIFHHCLQFNVAQKLWGMEPSVGLRNGQTAKTWAMQSDLWSDLLGLFMTSYCWWFRNPVNSPVKVGSEYTMIYKVLAPSKRWLGMGFLNHQQYDFITEDIHLVATAPSPCWWKKPGCPKNTVQLKDLTNHKMDKLFWNISPSSLQSTNLGGAFKYLLFSSQIFTHFDYWNLFQHGLKLNHQLDNLQMEGGSKHIPFPPRGRPHPWKGHPRQEVLGIYDIFTLVALNQSCLLNF